MITTTPELLVEEVREMYGIEVPLEIAITYIDAAERLGKKLKVVPDEGKEDLRDGWRYHVDLVDIEVVF